MDNFYTYNPTYWQNDITLLNAENMNNIEQGIVNLFLRPTIPDPRSITSEKQFSYDMIFKYLSYPKYQHTISGGIDDSFYDTLIEPGFHQIGTLSGIREVVFVTAPPGMGGYGSGHSTDSEAYRFQLSFQHERVRYRSCCATSTVESPEPGDWTEWKDLSIPNNMNFDSEEELEAELNTYIGHHSIRFASVGGYPHQYIIFTKRIGTEEFPKATYQVKLQINYNSAFHMYGRVYDSTWGEWNELTKPKDFVSWGYISTIKEIRDNSPQENKVYYFTKTTEEGNIPGGTYYCTRGFKDDLIHITPTVDTGIWYSLSQTGTDTAVIHYTAKQAYDASDPTPISGQGVAQALSNISASGLTPGSINNENLFSLDMMFKYLSYPKVQLSVSGEKPYDNIVEPGVYQVGGYGIPFEVLIVMAPQAGIGSGSTSDSDAYRYQLKMGDQNIEYRSSDDLENGWSEWVQLNINVDQTYKDTSTNAQSGIAVSQAIASAIIDAGSLPIYKKKYDTGYGDTEFNKYTDPGIYQVDTFTGKHEVVMVLSPDSEAYRMQLWFKYNDILYRGIWCTTDGVFADDDWGPWVSLTSGSSNVAFDFINAGTFTSLDDFKNYEFENGKTYRFYIPSQYKTLPEGQYVGSVVKIDASEPLELHFSRIIPDDLSHTFNIDNGTVTTHYLTESRAYDLYSDTEFKRLTFEMDKLYYLSFYVKILGMPIGTYICTYRNKVISCLSTVEGVSYTVNTDDWSVTKKSDAVNYFTLSNHMDGDIDNMLNEYVGDNFIGFISPLNNSSYIFINHYNDNDKSNHQRKLYTDKVRSRNCTSLGEWTEWTTASDYIKDVGEYFKSENVEGALQEIGETLNGLEDFLASI